MSYTNLEQIGQREMKSMEFYIRFTHGDESEILLTTTDKSEAISFAEKMQTEYKAAGKHGSLCLYTITTECGFPARKCFEFWQV